MRRKRTWIVWFMLAASVGLIAHLSGCVRLDAVRAVLVARPSKGIPPLTVEFDLEETSVGEGEGSFVLEFGDGTPFVEGEDFGLAIPHVYGTPGTFLAELTVIGADGETDRDVVEIVVSSGLPDEGSGVGDRAYDFIAPTTAGGEVTLGGLRGQVVLIEFWGSWCKPCRESMPHINSLWEKYHEIGLVVLAVSTDEDPNDPVEYLENMGFGGLICIWEPGVKQTRVKVMYDVEWIPRSIVVDKEGIIRYNGHPMDLAAGFIASLLAE